MLGKMLSREKRGWKRSDIAEVQFDERYGRITYMIDDKVRRERGGALTMYKSVGH